MAGSRLSKVKDDKTKKRKRDINEGDLQTKRPKAHQQAGEANGHERRTSRIEPTSDNVGTSSSPQNDMTIEETNPIKRALANLEDEDAGWRISKPMGGRMLDIDPILTADEQYLILAYNTSIQVYTATDSLLLRRIPITSIDASAPNSITPASIVSTRLSYSNTDYVWVACSDGELYRVSWKDADERPRRFRTVSGTAKAMTVLPNNSGKGDIVLVAESDKPYRMELVAYDGQNPSSPLSKNILALKKPGNGLQLIEASQDGRVLVGALNDRLFLGVATHARDAAFEQTQYDFISFDTPDLITALDLRVYPRSSLGGSGKDRRGDSDNVVDVIVGGARGAIYLYHDAVLKSQALGKSNAQKEIIQAQKYHWHRKAVHSLKWSRDGNYMVSGGSEQVLVMWQMDTSKKDFLPHLSGSVENIVVSASGSSYVLHLDDNSAMIISTAEMKPTAYVSGIQSAAVDVTPPKDLLVQRVWTAPKHVKRPIPAAIRPTEPSKLHVCVGNGRQATMTGDFSAPLLQSFDLESFMSVSKQALARTHPTDVNMTNKGHPIDEPLVTHIAFSGDGKWLASVDDWIPSTRDVDTVSSDLKDQFIKERHEVYLKFWQVRDGDESIALVSRVNSPHATNHPETVLDLASNTEAACFATIGADGMVRLWRPRTRQQHSTKGSNGHDVTWGCSQVIPVGDGLGEDTIVDATTDGSAPVKMQGSVAFSEDGSTIFAAFGAADAGFVFVINASTGEIIKTLEGLWKGKLQSIRTLLQYVIVLSDELHVYDVVSDDLRYGIVVPAVPGVDELLQLAVDPVSGYFAVTLPLGDISSVGIFHPEVPEPLIVRSTPHRIVSLVSSPGTSGFIALDDAAQIWVISEGSDPLSLAAAQPLQDLRLEDVPVGGDDDRKIVLLGKEFGGEESDDEMEEAQEADETEDVEMEDDDIHANVVPQQYLADIFDAAPAFAAVSVEDMFYKVTSLLATKPLSATPA
ncbi:U3 small nucleolar RNA-associated 17-like protein [Cladobotryum mycophilum]|uniref:U3 small nucleolar RNA-associated 17-like protein n=1 Tax=Cladobotryum mycophilum TaxID=491253 RepID=A0ABR0SM00_9HYPO